MEDWKLISCRGVLLNILKLYFVRGFWMGSLNQPNVFKKVDANVHQLKGSNSSSHRKNYNATLTKDLIVRTKNKNLKEVNLATPIRDTQKKDPHSSSLCSQHASTEIGKTKPKAEKEKLPVLADCSLAPSRFAKRKFVTNTASGVVFVLRAERAILNWRTPRWTSRGMRVMLRFESKTVFAAKGSRNMLSSAYLFEGMFFTSPPSSIFWLICPPTTITSCGNIGNLRGLRGKSCPKPYNVSESRKPPAPFGMAFLYLQLPMDLKLG
ncbi:histidine-containing phosphotransfer protein 1 [Striga asiatica]|uniref:Histidine-containing phosphotransfer protein 1 n=1 Tax=Striga asiatica TaxID=4170 RepID=A0A5A7PBS1_STRAF|nr:histidine-containing phosphotransfer protein 1 [Striga asiatica]